MKRNFMLENVARMTMIDDDTGDITDLGTYTISTQSTYDPHAYCAIKAEIGMKVIFEDGIVRKIAKICCEDGYIEYDDGIRNYTVPYTHKNDPAHRPMLAIPLGSPKLGWTREE